MTKAPTIPPAMVSVFYSEEMAVKERLLYKFERIASLCDSGVLKEIVFSRANDRRVSHHGPEFRIELCNFPFFFSFFLAF